MDPLVRCRGCSLVLLNPRVREDVIVKSYASAVDPAFFQQNPNRIRTFTRLFKKVLRAIGKEGQASLRVLDVGCAGGAFPKAAADLGSSVIGIEPSAWLCEQGKEHYGLDLRPGLLTEQQLPDKSFDIVTMWDVLEHLTQPGENLDEIHRLLKPHGTLVVSTPDYDSLARKFLRDTWPFYLNVHLFYFTRRTLAALLKKHGFELTAQFPLWQTLEFGYVLKRALAYFPVMAPMEGVLRPIRKMPITYQMGQTVFIGTKS